MDNILKQLEIVLQQRKNADANSSYVASLYDKGIDEILKKLAKNLSKWLWQPKTIIRKKSFMK